MYCCIVSMLGQDERYPYTFMIQKKNFTSHEREKWIKKNIMYEIGYLFLVSIFFLRWTYRKKKSFYRSTMDYQRTFVIIDVRHNSCFLTCLKRCSILNVFISSLLFFAYTCLCRLMNWNIFTWVFKSNYIRNNSFVHL